MVTSIPLAKLPLNLAADLKKFTLEENVPPLNTDGIKTPGCVSEENPDVSFSMFSGYL